jgi:hypothetical protein
MSVYCSLSTIFYSSILSVGFIGGENHWNATSHWQNLSHNFISIMGKKSLSSDGQQFHQYQQNEQSPFNSFHWTNKKRPLHMTVEIQVLDLWQTWWCDWIKPIHIAMSCNRYPKLQSWKALISLFNVNLATIWLQPPPTPPYPLYVSSKFSIDI